MHCRKKRVEPLCSIIENIESDGIREKKGFKQWENYSIRLNVDLLEIKGSSMRKNSMDILWIVGVILVWFGLQLWVLPKLGVPT